jgi:hypothetical protein
MAHLWLLVTAYFSAIRDLPSTTTALVIVIRIKKSKLLPTYLLCGMKIVASSFIIFDALKIHNGFGIMGGEVGREAGRD